MMDRTAHFDPITGAAGDMILAALIDAGAPLREIRQLLASLPLPEFSIDVEEVRSEGLRALRLMLDLPEERAHRRLADIQSILAAGDLPPAVEESAFAVFRRLAGAEGRVHGVAAADVHFHEVGALDAIVDIVGCAAALDLLEIGSVTFSPLRVGTGEVRAAHGLLPVPVPAVVELTRGFPVIRTDIAGEILTPTGAAILTTLGRPVSGEAIIAEDVGVGAGSRELAGRPNVLRVAIGRAVARSGRTGRKGGDAATDSNELPWEEDEVVVLETNVDDMSPEALPRVLEKALAAGARDAFLTPILMKKGRPAHLLTVLVEPAKAEVLAQLVLRETTTFGLRRYTCSRWMLRREIREIESPWGPIRVKLGDLGGGQLRVTPEYESCREIADRFGIPLLEVLREAEQLIRSSEWISS
jgi:uncharacterized protein (TIGR00299 family) protein